MRGKKAKMIRKLVFGDYSHRDTKYRVNKKTGEIRCVGLRGKYRRLKNDIRRSRSRTYLNRPRTHEK